MLGSSEIVVQLLPSYVWYFVFTVTVQLVVIGFDKVINDVLTLFDLAAPNVAPHLFCDAVNLDWIGDVFCFGDVVFHDLYGSVFQWRCCRSS